MKLTTQILPAARARRSARPGPGHRQLLRCRRHDQLPRAREVHERLRAGEGELCRQGRRPDADQGRDRRHARRRSTRIRAMSRRSTSTSSRPPPTAITAASASPSRSRTARSRSSPRPRTRRRGAPGSSRATTSPTSTASWSTASTLDEAVDKMRGDPGTPIKLTIVRPGPRQAVRRQHGPRADRAPPGQVGDQGRHRLHQHQHLLRQRRRRRPRRRWSAIDKATGGHPLGYVVDLRSNPGGLLDQAVDVADAFLDSGEIVSQRGREKDDIERYYARPGDMAHGLAGRRPDRCRHRVGVGNRRRRAAGSPPRADHGRKELRQGLGPDGRPDRAGERAAADHGALLHAVGPLGAGRRDRARHRRAAALRSGLQGPPGRSRGRSSPPPARPGQGRRQAARGRRHARSALHRDARRAGEEGHQGLPALLRAEHAEAAGRPGGDRVRRRRPRSRARPA